MSSGNEIGISPALLQAIQQTISLKNRADGDHAQNGGGDAGDAENNIIISRDPQYQQIIKVEGKGHSLEGLSEALSAMGQQAYQSGNTILVVQNPEDGAIQGVGEEQVYTEVVDDNMVVDDGGHQVAEPQRVISITEDPQVELGSPKHIKMSPGYQSVTAQQYVPVSSQSMSSVISVIASQISEQVSGDAAAKKLVLPPVPRTVLGTVRSVSQPAHSAHNSTTHGVIMSPNMGRVIMPAGTQNVSQTMSVPSPVRDVVVSGHENVLTETIIQTSHSEAQDLDGEAPKKLRIVEMSSLTEGLENGTTIILNPGDMTDGSVFKAISTEQGAIVYRTAPVSTIPAPESGNNGVPEEVAGGCPVCGDRVSGYHYGIYSCESCKGFFKRTVQNKKAFICHRMGECMVSIANRKKCPACRFKRCLVAGMRLEAIREDRMRGGRSSYDGCSPHRTIKLPAPKEPKRQTPASRPNVVPSPIVIQTPTGAITIPNTTAGPSTSSATIPESVAVAGSSSLTPGFPTIAPRPVDLNQVQPQTPQLLEDLMAVESLMMEEEEEQACCEGKMLENDSNLFGSLLHFADHCLYKIVRWARNLPDFANVPTDDQIILLQNCWAELLVLCCCWKSIRLDRDHLRLSHGRTISKDQAALMGIQDEIQRLLDFTHGLRVLETDNYEFVAIKGLLLFSPDVKNLKDVNVVRKYQDRITESLMIYTTTNSPDKPSKFCELLARLPELTRACVVAKDQLSQRQLAGQVPQYSLLSELLKGDVAVG